MTHRKTGYGFWWTGTKEYLSYYRKMNPWLNKREKKQEYAGKTRSMKQVDILAAIEENMMHGAAQCEEQITIC